MARGTWIYDAETQTMMPKGEYLQRKHEARERSRSALPRPAVFGSMPPIKSMADGKIYDTKGEYYKSVARAGCEIVGFDKNWTDHVGQSYDEKKHEADIVADVKKSIEQASSV